MKTKSFSTIVATGVLVAVFAFVASAPAQEIDKKTIKVTASSYEQKAKGGWGDMPPERALDGDLKTAWMAEGDGEWIQFDLGAVKPLKTLKVAFSSGDKRVYTFDILVSETGADNSWTTVAAKVKTSGKTLEMEPYDLKGSKARFVRIVGHGNTSEKFAKWCNVTEAVFVAE